MAGSMSTQPNRKRCVPPFPAEFVAHVAAASRSYMTAGADEHEEAVLRSAKVLKEVFDACPTRRALDDLNRRSDGAFTVWIPDAAMDLVHLRMTDDGVALLARLCATLGYAPFSPELLEGAAKGMRRWCSRDGEFEIDLQPAELARVVERVRAECSTHAREDQLGAVTGRPVAEWLEHAVTMLGEAGSEPRRP